MDTKGNLSSREAQNHPSTVTVDILSSGLGNLPHQGPDQHQGSEHTSLGRQEKRVRPLEQALTLEVSRLARQLDALRLQIAEREQQFLKLDNDFANFCHTDETLWEIAEPFPQVPLDRKTKTLRTLKTILRNRRSLYKHYSGNAALIACIVLPGLVTWYGLTLIGPKSRVARLAPDDKEIVYQPSLSQADSKVTAQVTYPNLISPTSAPQRATMVTPTQNASAALPVGSSSMPLPQPTALVQTKRSAREYEQAVYYALIDRNLAEFNSALEQAYQIDPAFHNLQDVRLAYKSLKQSGTAEAQLLRTLQLKVIKECQRWLTPEQLQQLQNQV
jgi:TolA-binding protein